MVYGRYELVEFAPGKSIVLSGLSQYHTAMHQFVLMVRRCIFDVLHQPRLYQWSLLTWLPVCDRACPTTTYGIAALRAHACPQVDRHDSKFTSIRHISDVQLREWRFALQPVVSRESPLTRCCTPCPASACACGCADLW